MNLRNKMETAQRLFHIGASDGHTQVLDQGGKTNPIYDFRPAEPRGFPGRYCCNRE